MNESLVHALFNHIPVIGGVIGFVVVSFALLWGNAVLRRAGLIIYGCAMLFVVPSFLSGERAEHAVEELPGVTEESIELHEELAERVLWLGLSLGVYTLIICIPAIESDKRYRWLLVAWYAVALFLLVLITNVSHQGAKIRRPELREGAPISQVLSVRTRYY